MPISPEEIFCIRTWMRNNVAAKEPVTRIPNEMLQRLLDELADAEQRAAELAHDVECYEAMKEGTLIRIGDLEQRAAEGDRLLEDCRQTILNQKVPQTIEDAAGDAAFRWIPLVRRIDRVLAQQSPVSEK